MLTSGSQPETAVQEAPPSAAPMDLQIYRALDELTDKYWRYLARHDLFFRLWARHRQPRSNYRVLDVGCGPGGLLAYFAKRTPMIPVGVDLFPGTLPYCRKRGIDAVSVADATQLPFGSNLFDLVIAQDVVEHIEDDARALAEIYRVCVPGGLTLIVVPAFEFLWSAHDVRSGHYRRYRLAQITRRVEEAGFSLVHRTYTDLFLLPLMWTARVFAPRTADGLPDINRSLAPGGSPLINRVLLTVSRLESVWARRWKLPWGVAALVLAGK